jgi:hypothetical protein
MQHIIRSTYKKERDGDLSMTIKRVLGNTENNPNFPNPPEALAKLKKLSPEYDDSVVNAKGREKEMVAIKKAKKAEAITLLTEVASYVTLVCNGDEALLLNSGFDISGQTGEQQSMPAIQKLIVELGPPGEVTIRVKRIRGARAYMHQYTTEPPSSESVWTSEGSTNAYITFRGLKSYTKYWFRIVALGPNGQTVSSPVDFRVIQ